MNRIVFTDPARLRAAIHFALNNECADELGRSLLNLMLVVSAGMDEDRDHVAYIGPDFAPHSFNWHIHHGERVETTQRGTVGLVGGFIYHGPGVAGDGSAPAFNVDLGAAQRGLHSWSIHT